MIPEHGPELVLGPDGQRIADDTDVGTGLVALRRYLDEHAGRLDAGLTDEGVFRLDAALPAGAR